MELWAVVFTDRDDVTTENSLHRSFEDAHAAGGALARSKWAEYTSKPFPEAEDDSDAMDALRTTYPVRLETEPIEVCADLFAALLSAEQVAVVKEALGDARAFRTDSGETPVSALDRSERESCERYEKLAADMGLTID